MACSWVTHEVSKSPALTEPYREVYTVYHAGNGRGCPVYFDDFGSGGVDITPLGPRARPWSIESPAEESDAAGDLSLPRFGRLGGHRLCRDRRGSLSGGKPTHSSSTSAGSARSQCFGSWTRPAFRSTDPIPIACTCRRWPPALPLNGLPSLEIRLLWRQVGRRLRTPWLASQPLHLQEGHRGVQREPGSPRPVPTNSPW